MQDFLSKLMAMLLNGGVPQPAKYAFYFDNASIHKSKSMLKFFEEKKMTVIFNSPYCPELAPVELTFANIKRILSKAETNRDLTQVIILKTFDVQ